MKGVVISGGNPVEESILLRELSDANIIVCADNGIKQAKDNNIIPNFLVGDLDSIEPSGLEFAENNHIDIIKYPTEKNMTDTAIAVELLIEKKCEEIVILSASGNRLDHTMNNIFILDKLLELNIKSRIIDNNNIIFEIKESVSIKKTKGRLLSILPISEKGAVLSLNGVKYPLKNKKLEFGANGGLCVSNVIIDEEAEIILSEGKLLVFISKD